MAGGAGDDVTDKRNLSALSSPLIEPSNIGSLPTGSAPIFRWAPIVGWASILAVDISSVAEYRRPLSRNLATSVPGALSG